MNTLRQTLTLTTLAGLLLCTAPLMAQQDKSQNRHNVYGEVMGNAVWYSVNYEFIPVAWSDLLLTTRLGCSVQYYRYVSNKYFAPLVPLESSALMRLNFEHMLEIGGGCTLSAYREEVLSASGKLRAQPDWYLHPFYCVRAGYRYQPRDKGMMFRIAYTHLVSNTSDPLFGLQTPWFGVSVGYCFR